MKGTTIFLTTRSRYFTEFLPITKGLSNNSIRSYQYTFQLLFLYLKETKETLPDNVSFLLLTRECIEGFLVWLEDKRECSATTRNQRLSCLSAFSTFAVKLEPVNASGFYADVTCIPKKKVCNNTPVFFTKEEIKIILNIPEGSRNTIFRDKVLMSVLYASGARAQELCDIKVSDVRFGEKTSVKLVGKGNRARIITIPSECGLLLELYLLNTRKKEKADTYVFSSQTHSHMSISCVEEIVKKYTLIAKEKHPGLFREKSYTPHAFRHSIAVHMLEAGVPLPVIKNFLGHVSIETTLIYATVTDELKNKYLKENSLIKDVSKKNDNVKNYDYESMGLGFLNRI